MSPIRVLTVGNQTSAMPKAESSLSTKDDDEKKALIETPGEEQDARWR